MSTGEPTEELFDAYAQVCRELGATQEVGPAHYRSFINLSDKALLELLELIVIDRAERNKLLGIRGASKQRPIKTSAIT